MRASGAEYVEGLRRVASVLVTLIIGVLFAFVTSVNAAPEDKKAEVKDKEKIEKIEKIEELEEVEELEGIVVEDSRSFNRNFFFNNRLFDNKRLNNNKIFIKDKDRD